MPSTRWTFRLGSATVLLGCSMWVWVALQQAPVDRVAGAARHGSTGELELLVRDLRLAPITLVLIGIAALISPSVRLLRQAAGVLAIAAVTIELVSVLLPVTLIWCLVTAVLMAVVAAGAVALARRWVARTATTDPAPTDTGRRLLALASFALGASAALVGSYVPDHLREGLPTGYLAVVPTLYAVFLVIGLAFLAVAATRLTWWHAVAAMVALGSWAGGWLITGMGDALGGWLQLYLMLGATVGCFVAAAVSGEPTTRRTWLAPGVSGIVAAALYPVTLIGAFFVNLGFGTAALNLNGGSIGVDGLPMLGAGPLSAFAIGLIYLAATQFWGRLIIPAAERVPPVARTASAA